MTARRRKKRRTTTPVRKTSRRWRVPPPLTHGPEPLEGGTILEEVPTPVGALLWETARDVRLWTSTPADERGELFSPEAAAKRKRTLGELELPPELDRALTALSDVLGSGDAAQLDELAEACGTVARWAESEGLLGVALSYAQSVALLHSEDPRKAYDVGLLARRRGENARAETWLRRAIMLARQKADWATYSAAFVGLGNLYFHRGNYPIARKLHVRAQRAAHRHSLHQIEAMALHDLFLMASASGDEEEAEELAAAALAAYGPEHERLPELAIDAANHWLERGYIDAALPVLEAVLPRLQDPELRAAATAAMERAHAASNVARAPDQAAARDAGPFSLAYRLVERLR